MSPNQAPIVKSAETARDKKTVLQEFEEASYRAAMALAIDQAGEFSVTEITGGQTAKSAEKEADDLMAELIAMGASAEEVNAASHRAFERATELVDF